MKTVFRWGAFAAVAAFVAAAAFVALACGGDDDGPPTGPPVGSGVPVDSSAVTLSEGALTFGALGDSTQLTVTVRDSAGEVDPSAAVAWSSTDAAVVTASASGWVVARGNGTAMVVASAGERADTVAVTVEQVAATVAVSPETATLAEGDTVRLSAVVADSNGVEIEGAAVVWTSADEDVLSVDEAGLVTALRWGSEAVVTASAGAASSAATVSVMDQIAFLSDRDGNSEIYVMNADGSGQTNLTNDPGRDERPLWSPDGTKIAYRTDRDGNDEIYAMNADGTDPTNLSKSGGNEQLPFLPSPDGTKIAFRSLSHLDDVYVMNADGSGQTRLTQDLDPELGSAWSPDGTKIAFYKAAFGDFDILVIGVGGSEPVPLVSQGSSDYLPLWRPRP